MIRLFLFFIFYSINGTNAQENPKNIISNEKNTIFVEEDRTIEEEKNTTIETNNAKDSDNSYIESNTQQIDDKSSIVVQDISDNDNNPWYGTLSSDNGGLGWMMWGNTSFSLSRNLIERINPSTKSPTLRILLRNIMLSRAKSPVKKSTESLESLENTIIQMQKLPYFEKKVFHLVNTGFNKDIDKLINSIPQDFKNDEFDKMHFNLRLNSFDIPYICNNVSKMLSTSDNLTFYRKILIVCKLILKKREEAMLALELLENDIEREDKFTDNVINYLENIKNEQLNDIKEFEEDNFLLKILSLYNYDIAKNTFKEEPILLYKAIYDLKLFTKELQIESLEFLVNQSIYDPLLLIEEYQFLLSEEELKTYTENQNTKENNTKLRAVTFKQILSSVSTTDRAKNIMKLWKLAEEKNIQKAISLITKNSVMSLSPAPTLNWFNLTAAKALILSNEIEAAKKWIFFGTSDIEERASIDINFCRILIFIYLYDSNILNYENQNLDLNFFLKVLKNDLNVNDKDFLRLILTLNALGKDIPSEMWEIFFTNETISSEYFKFIRNDTSNYFMLDNAISNNNIAEAALLAISFLQNEIDLYKEMFSFYKGLKGLYSVGLESYAKSYAMEENFYFLVK